MLHSDHLGHLYPECKLAQMPTRGVLYVKFGTAVNALLERSLRSLKQFHPELPAHIHDEPLPSNMLIKCRMADFTPFDETLYLDTDTVVLGRLDFAFDKAARHGLACCINECPWAKRYSGFDPDIIEYNSGVLFFTRAAQAVFDRYKEASARVNSTVHAWTGGNIVTAPHQDQAVLAKAIEETGFSPFVLPLNWNFRPDSQKIFYGPIKIWHAYRDPPPSLHDWNREQSAPGAIIKYGLVQ